MAVASFIQKWRISISVLIALGLVIGAYLVATNGALKPGVVQASTETALLKAIATKDSDGDGLTDWEESLYGTDPHIIDSKKLGMTDGEAVAKGLIVPKAVADIPSETGEAGATVVAGVSAPAKGSLTDKFAQNFLPLYLDAKQAKGGQSFTEEELADIAKRAVTQLMDAVAPIGDFKTARDLKVVNGGAEQLRLFAASVETIFVANQNDVTKSELFYLQDLMQKSDRSAIEHLASISQAYHQMAQSLSVLSVPEELATDYLNLINAVERIGKITSDFARVESDPLATVLALTQYPESVLALGTAFIHFYEIYSAQGVHLADGEPGASFINVIPDIAASQEAEATLKQP